ncbi:MAG: hypothetical protein DLM50_03460 [Candidatus Meridianibacter frigidus]|nr:MAG: hypothetical protein DLM50_03460 [Candidatus Eremiobacteraeota bacterium]
MRFSEKIMNFRRLFLTTAALIGLAACTSNSNTITPVPLAPQHLYVADAHSGGPILQYTLPLTGASMPSATIGSGGEGSLALDAAGNLAAGNTAGQISIFTAPLTSSSVPSATFNNGASTPVGQMAFNNAGDLFAATEDISVNVFTHPLTSASTPSQAITSAGLSAAIGTLLDSSGNLYVSNSAGAGSNIYVFAPPYSGTPIITSVQAGKAYRKMAGSGNQLFVANVSGATGSVDVYNTPLTTASTPAFSMTNVNSPEALAFDNAGNLYVGNLGDGTIRVFTPPFSAASSPAVTLVESGSFAIFGMAIGP